jgi:hypothetical protein
MLQKWLYLQPSCQGTALIPQGGTKLEAKASGFSCAGAKTHMVSSILCGTTEVVPIHCGFHPAGGRTA